jgi:hypothetical protein
VRQGHADVIEDRRQRQLLLTALALAVTTEIEAQARHACITKPSRQPREETAFLARHPATMDQNDSTIRLAIRDDERASQMKAIKSAEGYETVLDRHARRSGLGVEDDRIHSPRAAGMIVPVRRR